MSQHQYHSRLDATPLHLTSRGKAVILVLMLVAAASALRLETLATGLVAAFGIIGFLLYWRLVGVARAAAAASLRLERRIEGHLVEGSAVRVKLRVENPTPVTIEHLEVYEEPPRLWSVRGQPRLVTVLPGYSSIEAEYIATPVYGRHAFGDVKLVAYDPLGLLYYEVRVPASQWVEVRPRVLERVRGVYLVPSSPRPGGVAPGKRKGVGTIFYDVREYAPGDELRLIDWKAFARTGRLMVKEFEQEVQVHTLLVFDVTPTMFLGGLGETKLENTARVIRTVLEYVAARGDVYRLVLLDPKVRLYSTPWLRGRPGLPRALRTLSSVEWLLYQSSPDEVEDMGYERALALARLSSLLPREKTLVFLFTDALGSPGVAHLYASVLERLRALRHEVVALIPMTEAFELQMLERRDEMSAILYASLVLNRVREYQEIRSEFMRRGIPVVITGPVELASTVLQRLEAYRRLLS